MGNTANFGKKFQVPKDTSAPARPQGRAMAKTFDLEISESASGKRSGRGESSGGASN